MTRGREGQQEPKLHVPGCIQDLVGDGEGGDVFCVHLSVPVSSGHLSGSRWRPNGVRVSQEMVRVATLMVESHSFQSTHLPLSLLTLSEDFFKAPLKGCLFSYLMFRTVWPICVFMHTVRFFPPCVLLIFRFQALPNIAQACVRKLLPITYLPFTELITIIPNPAPSVNNPPNPIIFSLINY